MTLRPMLYAHGCRPKRKDEGLQVPYDGCRKESMIQDD